MANNTQRINAVPTNILTGFLGVGKTTAILHLLKTKPADQRWAVLVNEFGEIGVDGSLMHGVSNEDNGVFIREVPGGCMCCSAGLPMQVALNQLLTRARPDRVLIEPTGLGHPHEVLQVLSGGLYEEVLSVKQVLTLVNARHLADQRYTDNETFNQQIAIADIIVGNKTDLYESGDLQRLQSYVKQVGDANARVVFTIKGQLDPSILEKETASSVFKTQKKVTNHHHNTSDSSVTMSDLPLPACGYIKAVNQGDGYYSVGWRFKANKIFQRERLFSFLSGIEAERVKAVFITDRGVYGYNMASDALTEIRLQDCEESRIEIISTTADNDWDNQLLRCLD